MYKKLESLTIAQQEQLRAFRQQWFKIGTSTERADRQKAEAAIIQLREEIRVTTSPIFLWCESPATCLLALEVLRSPAYKEFGRQYRGKASLRATLLDSLWGSLRDSPRGMLADSLWSSLRHSPQIALRRTLGAALGAALLDSLWRSLERPLQAAMEWSLRAELERSLRGSLRRSLGHSLWRSLRAWPRGSLQYSLGQARGGQHELHWIAFYLFCRDVLHVEYDERSSKQLDLWRDIAQSCCWWWCYQNYIIVSERPTVVRMNSQERLHNENGPALAFADGWTVYALNGVRVPAALVETPAERLPATMLLQTTNTEVRREIVRKIGIERVCKDLNARCVDRQGDYELLELDLGDGRRRPYLKMLNPPA